MDDINSKILSTILFWTYVVIGLLTEGYILWLFPFTGLGGLICWPIAIFLSFSFSFGLQKIHKKFHSKRLTVISFIIFILIQTYFQLLTTPQEIGGEPVKQISEAISTYRQFDKGDFSDFPKLKQFERVVYIFKNRKSLPDSYLILSIDSVNDEHLIPGDSNYFTYSKTYLIENRNGKKSWNMKELGLMETDSSTIIIQRNGLEDSTVYETTSNLLIGGVGNSTEDNLLIFCSEDDLKLKTGFQEVFYDILSLTKKRAE